MANYGRMRVYKEWRSANQSINQTAKPFLRAAFRNHGELILGITRLERQITKASEQLEDISALTTMRAILQEQYIRAYDGLHNWRELLPEGVVELETKLAEKNLEEEKFETAISAIKDVAPYSEQVSQAVKRLMTEKDWLAQSSPFIESSMVNKPSRLLIAGAYDDAINAYSQLIADNPNNYTLYFARARVKYLAGDKIGALSDFNEIEKIHPGDSNIQQAKELITTDKPLEPYSFRPDFDLMQQLVDKANSLVADGNGESALQFFGRAASCGLPSDLLQISYAMSYLIMGDIESAKQSLNKVSTSQNDSLNVDLNIIKTLCQAMEGHGIDNEMQKIKESKDCCPSYNFEKSHVIFLKTGLSKTKDKLPIINKVFTLIG